MQNNGAIIPRKKIVVALNKIKINIAHLLSTDQSHLDLIMLSFDCQSCGACCAYFRVSFYWSETDAHADGTVPQVLTKSISPHRVAMLGTAIPTPRCVALDGEIGKSVGCSIYEKRSSTCREFEMGTAECLKARAFHGLSNSI